ncbi:MAG TPA: hypothetical protein VLJ60_04805, partial [bacterium]|nr:hypothetical protein [bacterium]
GYYCEMGKVKGNLMMFTTSDEEFNLIGCWYRFDKQKSYCYKKPWSTDNYMEFNTFDGKWHLWKTQYNSFIRDMDCYCKEEGICPFEE